MMTGYITTQINFKAIQKDIDAACALENAGRTDEAKKVLKSMKDKLDKDSK